MFPYSPHCPLLSHNQSPILDWNEVFKPGRNPAKRKGYVLSMRLCSQKSSLTPRSLGQPIQSPLGTEQFPLCPRLGPRCPLLSWFIGDWSSYSHGIPLQRTNQIKAATSGNQISRKLTTEKKKKKTLLICITVSKTAEFCLLFIRGAVAECISGNTNDPFHP